MDGHVPGCDRIRRGIRVRVAAGLRCARPSPGCTEHSLLHHLGICLSDTRHAGLLRLRGLSLCGRRRERAAAPPCGKIRQERESFHNL
eukprot:scaffold186230_cov35-Tisochrysis_lutea.AAC.4